MTDKASLFITYWLMLAPQTARDAVQWIPEYRFHPTRRWRFDFAAPSVHLAIEVNGGRFKALGGRHNSPADYEKTRAAVLANWRVLPFLTEELENNPADCISTVLQALGYAPLTD